MKKRIVSFVLAVVIFSLSCVGRIGYIIFSREYTASDGYNSYSLTVSSLMPTVYYSNYEKINNNEYSYVAVIRPNEKDIGELYSVFDYNKRNEIIDELKKGYPVFESITSKEIPKTKYIKIIKVRSSSGSSLQFINRKSGGLLSYCKDTDGKIKVNYSVDAKGRLLDGDTGSVIYDSYYPSKGLKLSIDKSIQKTVYDACSSIKSGCAVVMDVKTSSLLAVVNKPDDTYINKAFSLYSPGSVFKIVVAACGLENSVDPYYECMGSIKVGDTAFSCQGGRVHSNQHIKQALANSCNCYFVNLALRLGEKKILKTAKSLGFDDYTQFFGEWKFKNASLPDDSILQAKGQLSLFGFGQGALLATPLQICNTLCTVSNKGTYTQSSLVSALVDKNMKETKIPYESNKNALSKATCEKLLEYMRYVVTNGTASSAEDSSHKSAGKTATAQTGQYSYTVEKLNTWFAGVYPYDNPRYAIVIMTENGTSGSQDCCPVFRTIVENLK